MKPEKKTFELTDDEKVLMDILKANSPIDLNALKEQTGLSNKKWDKAIKGLTKKKTCQGGENRCRLIGLAGITHNVFGQNDLCSLNPPVGAFFLSPGCHHNQSEQFSY